MTHADSTVFLVDTSVWIRLHEEIYPPDVFPTLYKHLQAAAQSGRIRSPRQVLKELGEERGGGVGAWVRAIRPSIGVNETPRVGKLVGEIVTAFPALVKSFTGEQADPYLVALAEEHGYTVVTEERRSLGPASKPKLPDVCLARHVRYINTIGLLRALQIQI